MVLLTLVSGFIGLIQVTSEKFTFWSWSIYSATDTVVSVFMLYTMWRLSGKTETNYEEITVDEEDYAWETHTVTEVTPSVVEEE